MQSQAKQYLSALYTLQGVKDSLVNQRISLTMTTVLDIMQECENKDILRIYGKWIITQRGKVLKVKQFCSKNSSKVSQALNRVPPPSPPPKRRKQ